MTEFPVSLFYDNERIVGKLLLKDEVASDLEFLADSVLAPGYTVASGTMKVEKVVEFSLIRGKSYDSKTNQERIDELKIGGK